MWNFLACRHQIIICFQVVFILLRNKGFSFYDTEGNRVSIMEPFME